MLSILIFIPFSLSDPKPLVEDCPAAEPPLPVQKRIRSGAEVYQETCAMCHGKDGRGTPGVFPPLLSEWAADEVVLANIILRGVVGEIYVSGARYASAMPGFEKELSNEDVLAVISYVQSLNGKESTLREETVQEIRLHNVPAGSISGQVELEDLRAVPFDEKVPHSSWKGCTSSR